MAAVADNIKVKSVKGDLPLFAAELHYLQLKCLPYDQPLPTDTGYWWIAYHGDIAVAFAGLSQSPNWSDTGYLARSGVIPSYRGRGLQRRLLRIREKKARKLNWNWLITDTCHNPASSNNLIACGFKIFEPTEPWGLPEAVYWRKNLN